MFENGVEYTLLEHQLYWLAGWLAAVYFIVEAAGIYYAFHAILNSRTSQAGIA